MFERDPDSLPRRPAPSKIEQSGPAPGLLHAQLMALQRTVGNAGVASLLQRTASAEEEVSPVKELMNSGGGSALDGPTRSFMESRLGADFSDVRVHTGAKATEAARSVQAHAYTVGTDLVFQDGQYNPSSNDGRKMLAHELTHVMQQRSGPVDGTPAAGGISVSDPSDRFERAAEATADRVMAGEAAGLQRQETGEEEEEEGLQASSIQRQESAGEEDEEVQASSAR